MSNIGSKLKAKTKAKTSAPHLVITARAGTGKTTTLVEGLKILRGEPTRFTPSPQQQAIWDAIKQTPKTATACFVAFNKSIAEELQRRVPEGVDAMTMHSLGYKAVKAAFGSGLKVSDYRVMDIIADILHVDIRELRRQPSKMAMINAVKELVGLCKNNLLSGEPDDLSKLVSHYGIEMDCDPRSVFDLCPQVLERCKEVDRDRTLDFDDMVWLPAALDLTVPKYDLLIVDEAQDLNRCQQSLAKKAGHRLIFCGDDKQAIYGFAGADAESLPRLVRELGETEQGCVNLPLTVTRRCGRKIVEEARLLVPDFEAHEDNGEGEILTMSYDANSPNNYRKHVTKGDMILCRVNAPLVSECFRFLKAGVKVQIQGRDVGAGLIRMIDKLGAISVPALIGLISDWKHAESQKELAKRNPSDSRLLAIQDKHDCLVCFTEGMQTVDDVRNKIKSIFTDDKTDGIKLSSVHKAKGLEASKVFILFPKGAGMPHPMCKTPQAIEQDRNLLYVARTRAINTLVYVKEEE